MHHEPTPAVLPAAVVPAATTARGFTLIELLIVISIIGLLAVVLLPRVVSTTNAAKEDSTRALMLRLSVGCEQFAREHGYYPPDDLKNPETPGKMAWKPDNGQNTGIESLVAFLSQSRRDGADLSDLGEKQLSNTDKDDHGAELPMLNRRKDRCEVTDAWGTPLVYFSKSGIDKQQMVAVQEGDTLPAKAKKRDDGRAFGDGKYQILSAGKDTIFGTDDDLVWPNN